MLPGLQYDMHQKYDNRQKQVRSKYGDIYLRGLSTMIVRLWKIQCF